MEEKKYYTPEIQEIHVGLTVEYFNTSMDEAGDPELNFERWEPWDLRDGNVENFMKYGIGKGVRVKYLDKSDIEELGGKRLKMSSATAPDIEFYSFQYKDPRGNHDSVIISFNPNNKWILISLSDTLIPGDTMFAGTVKNKSRLKLVMEMVGIL